MVKHLQEMECPRCHKMFQQHKHNHAHCTICAAAINIERNIEKARARRLAQKAAKENQAS